ncbi:MAG: biosynthetic arginine decarboxylase [Planctomycetota bacterium]|nr:biosynthetic arginine decarboxylase [Planctomycetota bacterium]
MESWSVQDSVELYGVNNWGRQFFSANDQGHLVVHPTGQKDVGIDLRMLVADIEARGIGAPMLIRFPDILKRRVEELNTCFATAIKEHGYRGCYRGVYPIKVNQERHVVEAIVRHGKECHFGLEAGSKPELMTILALLDTDEGLFICNGYKDEEYVEMALLASKLGRKVVIVMEKLTELDLILRMAEKHKVRPMIGMRAKLNARGTGRWETSSGDRSKFGFTAEQMLKVCDTLRERGMLDCLQLLHFHIGSQVSAIRNIKAALREAARFYVELHKLGAGLKYLNVGGGLAVDYDGSNSNFEASMNYSMQEYANDAVFQVMEVCDEAGVEHPHIVSESGRALTAHHSVLIFNVLGVSETVVQDAVESATPQAEQTGVVEPELPEDAPNVLWNLRETCNSVTRKNYLEAYHDAVQMRDEAVTMFNLGYLSLKQRGLAERLFWATCRRVLKIVRTMPMAPEELEHLERSMADTYFCNFSLFQSVPDHWAIYHHFPIMPIHRLNERPTRRGVLADITCDSDGKIEDFIDLKDVKNVLELHPLTSEPYCLGVFMVGAYQEILGDLHNLFGDTNAVHVSLENGSYKVEQVETGDTVEDVLHYVSYDKNELIHRLRTAAEAAVRANKMTLEDLRLFVTMYQNGMDGYTYLEG